MNPSKVAFVVKIDFFETVLYSHDVMMQEDLLSIREKTVQKIESAEQLDVLDSIRIDVLGKKGTLTDVLKGVRDLAVTERPVMGQLANQVKQAILDAVQKQEAKIRAVLLETQLAEHSYKDDLPGVWRPLGALHPLMQMQNAIIDVFSRIGFSVKTGPELEDELHNFEALNIPSDHPARDMHDTFYMKDGHVLRTHTSPVQIRHMKTVAPPVKIVVPGKVFRCDSDVSHSPVFHQIEGLYVDKSVRFSDLKGTLEYFLQTLFGTAHKVRFRPSYFPFTEPSCEVDLACVFCAGNGCSVCKQTGWLEVMGAGMVHHHVFRSVNYDPNTVSGFAFGVGVDRLAMLRYRIDDIRLLYENDSRFLRQFT